MKTQRNVPIEIPLPKEYGDELVVISSSQNSFNLPVFIKSNGKKYVRFASDVEATYTFDIHGEKKTLEIEKYRGSNPLFLNGPIRVAKNKTLEHVDKSPFFYLSDTWWFGMT